MTWRPRSSRCAPRPSARLAAMRILADNGIQTGVTMMPILPFIEDNEENIDRRR